MRRRELKFAPEARADMADAWQVYVNDGEQRADQIYAVMEAFCRSLGEFCQRGTKHDERTQGLRSSGIPCVQKDSVLFLVGETRLTVMRVGYLGNDVWSGPEKGVGGRVRERRHRGSSLGRL
jgi:plasmid stabilization system protein ParE